MTDADADGALSPYRALAADLASGRRDPSWLTLRLDFIDARLDLSDHRLVGVLKLYLAASDLLTEQQRERIERTILGFKYHWDEPGVDGMCSWSETHQLLFGVCEYLAGQTFEGRVFSNDGRTGRQKRRRAAERLNGWLYDRFHHGFAEWLSNTYYELDVIGLSLLIDHADDPDLVTRASMVLDLVFFDLALHRFRGRFIASAGRAYARQKTRPSRAEVNTVLDDAFVGAQSFDPDQLAAVFVGRDRYRVPRPVVEVAMAPGAHRIHTSHGLDLTEALLDVARRPGLSTEERRQAVLRLLWAMEAFVTPEGIAPSLEEMRRTTLSQNRFLVALGRYQGMRSNWVATAALRAINPIQQGAALHRANVQTFRTPHYLLSSAQHYQPGRFGDQQHLWVAALPGDISVFATHPGATLLSSEARPSTPSAWVGNGLNPDVAQSDNVLLALYDTSGRAGHFEGYRHEFSHLYFPFARFDETSLGDRFLVGRREDSFIGVLATSPLEMVTEAEVVQRGQVTGWAVVVADRSEFGSLAHLSDWLRRSAVRLRGSTLDWVTPEHRYALSFGRGFRVDGRVVTSNYPRYDTEWARVPRDPHVVTIRAAREHLWLDWDAGVREVLSDPTVESWA